MNIQFLSPEQVQRALVLNWTATLIAKAKGLSLRIPTALVGDTGCGKTDSVRAFYKTLNEKAVAQGKTTSLWSVRMSHVLPEDLGGYAAKDEEKKKLVHYMLDCLPFDCQDMGVIFLDEFDRAPIDNQNAALPLVYGDDFHGHSLSDNAYVCLALNGSSDSYTTPLSKALRTRVCSLFVSRNAAGGYDSYDKWAVENGIPDIVRYFHKYSGNMIESNDAYEELAVCTPRTLDMAGMITLAKEAIEAKGTLQVDDVYNACIAGVIGQGAAAQYLINEELVGANSPKVILDDPNNAAIPHYRNMQFIVDGCSQFIKHAGPADQPQLARNYITFAARITNDEWEKAMMDALAESYPQVVALPEYSRHMNRR